MQYEAPDYSPEGVKSFFDTALYNPDFMQSLDIYGAFEKGKLQGMIATRSEKSHIALLFAESVCQKKGIGRGLLEYACQKCPSEFITVKSSPYATEFYHHPGFWDTDTIKTVAGIRFTPMKRFSRP